MTKIPQPPTVPFVGNLNEVDSTNVNKSYTHLAKIYGPVFRLNLMGENVAVVGKYDAAKEVFDEKRFLKIPAGSLLEVRNGVGDGLFSAFEDEENWGIAHRILMPKFGPMAIRDMFDEMHDITCQLVSKLAREGSSYELDPRVDFTKLTLDSIALCAMGTRFNSFLREEMHPFPTAMRFFLQECGQRALRPAFLTNYVYRASTRKYWESIEVMKATALQAVNERREHPIDKPDLLNAMLHGKDPKTGQSMSEQSIINNAISFLIAGHETTSGLLSFLFVLLLQNPNSMRLAQEEVDRVIGENVTTADHMNQLPYITACLRESLRLWPIVPMIRKKPRSKDANDFPIFLGKDQYEINKDDTIHAHIFGIHRDPEVYPDPLAFVPERMLDEAFNKLPPNSWKPFGNGSRACIGRAFAWQEATLATAMLLQNFTFQATDPAYKIDYNSTLSIKPTDFTMRATLRPGLDHASVERRIWGGKSVKEDKEKDERIRAASTLNKSPMAILYGSNTGTCESLAQSLANTASSRGYSPSVKPMDGGVDELSKDQPVVIITASYEGEPPDNACHFIEWMTSLKGSPLQKSRYAVFGCGNHDWVTTFHRIPKLVDDTLASAGASRIAKIGLCDVANGRISDDFDSWADAQFWPGIEEVYGKSESAAAASIGLDIDLEPGSRATDLRQDVREAIVLENKQLTAPGEPIKKHITIQLPSGTVYATGDYLAVLPVIPEKTVKRAMARFNIAWDARITIREGQHTFLPIGKTLPVFILLSAYVELNVCCTKKNLSTLAAYVQDEKIRQKLESTSPDEIASKCISVLDLLEMYPTCCLPFGDYLAMLSPLRVRQYSISSSPLTAPEICTLTYSVLDQEAKVGGRRFLGAASNYLAELTPGEKIQVSVRPSHQAFHPPTDAEHVPVIMICAGTGLAPFHGFVEERAKQHEAGRSLAPALLFIGCRDPEKDALYADQLAEWARKGIVDVRYAFSRAPEKSEGCKYVQDRLSKDGDDARKLWHDGGRIFVCGSGAIGEAVKEAFIRSTLEGRKVIGEDMSREEAEAVFNSIRNERFATDVFA